MKNTGLLLLATFVLIGAQEPSNDYHFAKWNGFNVKEIVENERIFGKYKQCLTTDKVSGCPQEVQELKEILFDALESTCDKCSPSQLTKARELLAYVCKIRGSDFIDILQHFDPAGANRAHFESKFGKLDC